MLMFIISKWVEEPTIVSVMVYACFYGGFGQMVAGVFEVRPRASWGRALTKLGPGLCRRMHADQPASMRAPALQHRRSIGPLERSH